MERGGRRESSSAKKSSRILVRWFPFFPVGEVLGQEQLGQERERAGEGASRQARGEVGVDEIFLGSFPIFRIRGARVRARDQRGKHQMANHQTAEAAWVGRQRAPRSGSLGSGRWAMANMPWAMGMGNGDEAAAAELQLSPCRLPPLVCRSFKKQGAYE